MNNLKQVYRELILNLKKIKGKKILYTHALEGGHLDHDCCYYLTLKQEKILLNSNNLSISKISFKKITIHFV